MVTTRLQGRSLAPSTLLWHLPPDPYPERPSFLLSAARRWELFSHCADPRQKEGVTFWARVGRAVELAIRIQPSGECNPAHSHSPGPRIASRFTCVALIYGAPAQRLSTVLRARRSRSEWPKLIYIALAMRIGADFVYFGAADYFRLCSVCRALREILGARHCLYRCSCALG